MHHLATLQKLGSMRCPARFVLKEKPFVVEIQYFTSDTCNKEAEEQIEFLIFAVTTDGHELLVPTDGSENILQREFGVIDELGVTLDDLLGAHYSRL